MKHKDVVVLGAGMIGVCSALALQKKGLQVTLIDSAKPGSETSFGNAGIITPSSLIPINNPRLIKALPGFMGNKSAGFRYNLNYAFSEMMTLLQFLSFAKETSTKQRVHSLYQLIERSTELHIQQADKANCAEKLRFSGWLKLYRQAKTYHNARYEQDIYQQYNVSTKVLDNDEILTVEPRLKAIYQKAVLIEDALSVASPSALVNGYADEFVRGGGQLLQLQVESIQQQDTRWILESSGLESSDLKNSDSEQSISCKQLVIAAGPWSKQLLEQLGMKLPMLFERGGHREYVNTQTTALSLPIHDIEGSFVASPTANGLRVSCGVELNHHLAKHSNTQLDIAEHNARQGLTFGDSHVSQWQGARPTMPDSLPVIGASKLAGLWLNTGHQHIGFSTGPGSAEILANLVCAQPCDDFAKAFSPQRFGL
ncbi:MAG: FAD-dependent oxidoreductase [Oceanospirillaceae bacterium]